MAETFVEKTEIYNGEMMDIIYRQGRPPVDPSDLSVDEDGPGMDSMGMGVTAPFNQRTYLAAPGIICEQDVPVKMRDGITIYVDIFRPENETDIPVLVSWSFYGKRPSEGMSEWQIMGVPPGTISPMAKFESPDPGYWCHHGYAVANVDPRGIGHSEGNASLFGSQDARDGYDFIEWVAEQWWCNGKVGMSGNSCLAMTQWRIAAQQPPHLVCIAPWEGTSDLYRESLYEGGIPALTFNEYIVGSVTGPNGVEDLVAMGKEHPLWDDWYKDHQPDFKKIKIPVYATACWNHFHLRGAFEGFRKIKSKKKWMRAHQAFEWPDAFCSKGISELRLFFDRYLKDIHNGWELTPRVRIEVQDAYDYNYQIDRPETSFPLKRTEYKKLYLDAESHTMSIDPVDKETSCKYESNTEEAVFDYRFEEDTEITGYMRLRLWVAAESYNDLDLFVNIQKLSTTGEWLPITLFDEPHPGAWGKLRVSHRALDEELSTSFQPVHSHLAEEKLEPGEIVPVDIEIVPTSRIWHKGQSIRVQVAGRYIREGWFEPLSWETDNVGNHIIYTGGQYDSHLQIPVIPPKYQDGDYVYR